MRNCRDHHIDKALVQRWHDELHAVITEIGQRLDASAHDAAPSASVGGVEAGVAQTAAEGPSNVDGNRGADRPSGEEQRSSKPLVPGSIPGPSLDPTQRPSDAWVTFECKHCHVWVRGNPGFTFDAPCGRSSGEHEWERLRPNEASTCAHGVAMTQACMTCISRGDDPRGDGFRPRTPEVFGAPSQEAKDLTEILKQGVAKLRAEQRPRACHVCGTTTAKHGLVCSASGVPSEWVTIMPRAPEASHTVEQCLERFESHVTNRCHHASAQGCLDTLAEWLPRLRAALAPRTDHPRAAPPYTPEEWADSLAKQRGGNALFEYARDIALTSFRAGRGYEAAYGPRSETASPKLRADLDAWVERFIRPHFEGKCDGLTKDDCVETIRLDLERLATHEKGEAKP